MHEHLSVVSLYTIVTKMYIFGHNPLIEMGFLLIRKDYHHVIKFVKYLLVNDKEIMCRKSCEKTV